MLPNNKNHQDHPAELKARLLIVDDEINNLHHLGGILKDDYEIILAASGEEALKRALSETPPDLILLDIIMPEMDGYQVCRALQQNILTQEIPVIFVTAKNETEDEAKGLAAGAVDYITKPFQPAIIQARLRTHLALRRQKARLLTLNDIKNRFVGIAAHDLRNPLTTIRGMCEILLEFDGLTEQDRKTYLQTIFKTSDQMLSLVNDLLDVSTIDSGAFELKLEASDLNEIIKFRLQLMTPHSELKGIKIINEFARLPAVSLDQNRLGQVIDNLLSNAIKFSHADTCITISTALVNDQIEMTVKDQGPGIPEEELRKIFQPFQKLSVQSTAGEKSTGLGMAIVNKIVEAHHGSIEVKSQLGEGSAFIVRLPVTTA